MGRRQAACTIDKLVLRIPFSRGLTGVQRGIAVIFAKKALLRLTAYIMFHFFEDQLYQNYGQQECRCFRKGRQKETSCKNVAVETQGSV